MFWRVSFLSYRSIYSLRPLLLCVWVGGWACWAEISECHRRSRPSKCVPTTWRWRRRLGLVDHYLSINVPWVGNWWKMLSNNPENEGKRWKNWKPEPGPISLFKVQFSFDSDFPFSCVWVAGLGMGRLRANPGNLKQYKKIQKKPCTTT